jgi:hypothetical protein
MYIAGPNLKSRIPIRGSDFDCTLLILIRWIHRYDSDANNHQYAHGEQRYNTTSKCAYHCPHA